MNMWIDVSRRVIFLLTLFVVPLAAGQQSGPPAPPASGAITLDVVVTRNSSTSVSDLQQQDFTLLDNKVPQSVTSFQSVKEREAPIDVILVVDAVNANFSTVAYERDQLDKFLRTDLGALIHPTSLVVLTDTGIQILEDFSNDGNKLSASLDRYTGELRVIQRSAGFYGATERFQISLSGLHVLVEREALRPGRKMMIWISPGWPLLSGPEVELSSKAQQQLFGDIVSLSTELLNDRITLYSVDPFGAQGNIGRTSYWQSFVKGINKPSQALPANLALQVLADQSGGLALYANNEITALLDTCLADARAYYELSFEPSAGGGSDQYHRLEIRVTKPGFTARTRHGYYSQPKSGWQHPPSPLNTGGLGEPPE